MRAHAAPPRHPGLLAALAALTASTPAAALSALALAAALAACEAGGPPLPWAAVAVPPIPWPEDAPATEEQIELGRLLFHDPVLSSDREVACVTCHAQIWGLSDGLPRSIGVGGEGPVGTGRTGPTHTRRNSQTLWNVAYRAPLFFDGRAASLEDQVGFPLADAVELGRDEDELAAELRALPAYAPLFAAAFPAEAQPVSYDAAARAIAAFERTLVSDNAPYDQYVRGDERALSETARRGMFLFAEVGCADCHTPPLFESPRYDDVGVPALAGEVDRGRAEVTDEADDEARFRVPTLRNLRETAPYFHTGAAETMEDAVRAHGGVRPLADDDVADLVAFLAKGLTDRSREPRRPLEVPSGLPIPVDGYRVPR